MVYGMTLSEAELTRYSRQTKIPGWGLTAQQRLRRARVAVVGAGGLGSGSLLYLAAAGVGRLGVIDDDEVALSNLHRQVLHTTSGIGAAKSASAAARLAALNPHVEVVEHRVRLVANNILDVLRPYDIVVDGSDSFSTRYLVNDACVLLGVPLVWASVLGFDGQVSVFGSEGPCLRCLFPKAPAPGEVPSCVEAGVLGFVPGVLGISQAAEAIKLATGVGQPMIGRVGVYDGLAGTWSELPLRRAQDCPGCSSGARPVLQDETDTCSLPEYTLSVADLRRWLAEREAGERPFTLIDLRDVDEGPLLDGAVRSPLAQFLAAPRPVGAVVLYCQSGVRSGRALEIMRAEGVDAHHLAGGMKAWVSAVAGSPGQ